MSKSSLRASASISTTTCSPRWTPLPHEQDSSIKTFDFAYATGAAPPTATDRFIAAIKALIANLFSDPLLLRILLLIFGGCCSNVYTLESILTLSSSTGTLITLLQFISITLYTFPSQLTFTVTSPPHPPPLQPTQTVWIPRVKKRKVPLREWCVFAAQFVLVNVLNNAAFEYKISLPLHIILRSAGPVASMAVGYIWKGRSYSRRKVFSVTLLFFGVVLAALSDAGTKAPGGDSSSQLEKETADLMNATTSEPKSSVKGQPSALAQQAPGFALLTLALILSSVMGVWSDTLYTRYGRSPAIASEQLFYGHLLSLPFFLLQHETLYQQFASLMALTSTSAGPMEQNNKTSTTTNMLQQFNIRQPTTSKFPILALILDSVPRAIVLLFLNSTTQIACISGVHHLSTQTSALTVSIVLNIRKVVSLLLSIWLFGNNLPVGVLAGAAIVFIGGGLYGIPDKQGVDMKKVEEAEERRLAGFGKEVQERGAVGDESKKNR